MALIPYVEDSDALQAVEAERGWVSNFHRLLAHSPSALTIYEQTSRQVRTDSTLSVQMRELATLRICQLLQNEYDWRRHVTSAIAGGVPAEQITELWNWPDSDAFDPISRAVLAVTDDVVLRDGAAPDHLHALVELSSPVLVVDLLVTIGFYRFIGSMIATTGMAADDTEQTPEAFPFRSDPAT